MKTKNTLCKILAGITKLAFRSDLLRTSCGYRAYFLRLELLLTAESMQKVRRKVAATGSYPPGQSAEYLNISLTFS